MTEPRQRRRRDPDSTREAILEAARTLLARDGPERISLSEVAHLAGVNRGTAYQHFETREKLIEATLASVSHLLLHAVYGNPEQADNLDIKAIDVAVLNRKLADFAIENPELCRIWLMQLLASPEPAQDPFWRQYLDGLTLFAASDQARPGIDCEVLSLIMVAGNFLWPVWVKSDDKMRPADRRRLARRFADEALRLSLFGTMAPEHFPELVRELDIPQGDGVEPGSVAAGR